MNTYIEIKEKSTKKVVKRFDVTGKHERMIEKFDDGLNINLNHDKFYTIINKTKRKYKCED